MFKHILLPTDGSKLSGKAARQAVKLARTLGAKITALNVVPAYKQAFECEGYAMPRIPALQKRFDEETAAHSNKLLGPAKRAAAAAGVHCISAIASGDSPYKLIIAHAIKSRCDLIMMASHGRRGLGALILGSETQKVLTHSKIPVLVCR